MARVPQGWVLPLMVFYQYEVWHHILQVRIRCARRLVLAKYVINYLIM